jgi:CubicO group peptidase (beta-lactamase class C family)
VSCVVTGSVLDDLNHAYDYPAYAFIVVVAWGWFRAFVHRVPPCTGDRPLAAELGKLRDRRTRNVAAAVIDVGAEPTVRLACAGAATDTRFEIGSVTKGLTGMLLAEAIERGELALDTELGAILSEHQGSPFGSITMRELCTHRSGLPNVASTFRCWLRAWLYGLFGTDPYRGSSPSVLMALAARQPLTGRGGYRYSNLGAAVLGQLLAVVAGTDYARLLDDRVFRPLGMGASAVSRRGVTARPGRSGGGRRRQPWIMDGYAPAGGVVSTIEDMAILAGALLEKTAPGTASLRPVTSGRTGKTDETSGMFWVIHTPPGTHGTMIWHNGQTGGYSAYLVLYPETGRGVIVLADVARASEQQRIALGLTTWLVQVGRPK